MKTPILRILQSRVLFVFAFVLFAGCASETGTVTRAPISHFSFVGNIKSAVVSIDEQQGVILDGNKLVTSPGKHRIRITKGGRLVVDREVMVGDQQTLEISIP